MTLLDLEVATVTALTPSIRSVGLVAADPATVLPGFAAGAHVALHVPGVGLRKYSLVNTDPSAGATAAPRHYTLAVRLDPHGDGGSRFVHALAVGDRIAADPPQNAFPLKDHPGPAVLIAGGIGVTPLLSMAAELKASRRPFRFVYAAREAAELAYHQDLLALAGQNLILHLDAVAGRVFDMHAAFAALGPADHVYMCGPKPMLKAGMDAAKATGLPRSRLAFELFYSVAGKS
jgi:vanillate O-demethylase ferredoxin subunit